MGNNAAIDVAIALMLMYLVLSLIVTVLNEMVATAIDLRAANLRTALVHLLDNDTLRRDFFDHGLVAGTNKAVADAPRSYLSRSIAWFYRLVTPTPRSADDTHVSSMPGTSFALSYISGKSFASALLGSLDPTKPLPAFNDIKGAIQHMPDSNIRDTLLAHLATADGSLEKLRDDVATWFDSAMDRVTGVYKRHLKRISIFVGLIVVLALNADTIKVGKSLWSDAGLRQEMVQAAGAYLDKSRQPEGSKTDQSAGGKAANAGLDVDEAVQKIQTATARLRPLPMGWSNPLPRLDDALSFAFIFVLISKCIGLLLTAIAISLGAPFWFDLLAMVMHVRGTGEKPKKTAAASSVN
jgi:hypothetical protein